MTFAKLENGILKRCPKAGMSGNGYISNLPAYYNNNPDKAYADGWLELILTDKPEGHYVPKYKVEGHQLIQYWVELPAPEPVPDPMDRLDVLEGAVLELADYLLGGGGLDV